MDKIDNVKTIEDVKERLHFLDNQINTLELDIREFKINSTTDYVNKTEFEEKCRQLNKLEESVNSWSKKVSSWSERLTEAVNEGFTHNKKEVGQQSQKTKQLEQTILNNERDNKKLLRENAKLRQDLRDMEERTAKTEEILKQVVKRMNG